MLTVSDLTLARGDRVLIRDLSLRLEPGEARAVVGPNGWGKTSLLRAVAGLLKPLAGRIALTGFEERQAGLHLMGHQDGLKGGRTAGEELIFWCGWAGADRDGVDRAVERLALTPLLGLPVRVLSAGQKKRLALARLIAAPRPLWLLDETLAPLDTGWRETVADMARAHLVEGGMILAAAHDPMPFAPQTLDLGAGAVSALALLFRREFGLAWGRGGGAVMALAFFACITALTPLTVGSEPERLAALAIGSSWLALALASLLSLERLFERDFEDGALDLLAIGPVGLIGVCAIKAVAQWVAVGLPLAVAAPIATAALGAPDAVLGLVLATAAIGGLGFAFTGMMGAALALGSRRGGLLIAVVVLPLFAPPAIFGAGTLVAASQGLPWMGGLALISAWTLFSTIVSPMVAAFSVRDALG